MRQLAAEALLLDVVDLHDRDRIVTFLTAPYGKKRGVARAARRKYSRFAGQLQPLAKVSVRWFEKEGRDLVRIRDVDMLRPGDDLQRDLEGILLGSYFAEHMTVFAQENEGSELLYRLLTSSLEALRSGVDRDLVARYYEAWVLRLAGVFPSPDQCPSCGTPLERVAALAPHGEGLLCLDCAGHGMSGAAEPEIPGAAPLGTARVGAEVLRFLRRIGRTNLEGMSAAAPAAATLRQVEQLCGRVRRHFLGHELRSYEVMRRTLAEVGTEAGGR